MTSARHDPSADGFHEGELTVQQRAGVTAEAARLRHMVEPGGFTDAHARFLAERSLALVTARDADGRLWISPIAGPPGFLHPASTTRLSIRAIPVPADPLHDLPVAQPIGVLVIEPATRRRIRVNGTLTHVDDMTLTIAVGQVFGNCPKYIQRRTLTHRPLDHEPIAQRRAELDPADIDQIRAADTFFLGTTHPARGNDASHRGGPPGFVHVDGNDLEWQDFPGNNLFNSLGNLAVDPTAALLFTDLHNGRALHLTGTATTEWHRTTNPAHDLDTGRRIRFTTHEISAGDTLTIRAD